MVRYGPSAFFFDASVWRFSSSHLRSELTHKTAVVSRFSLRVSVE
jgi:hypothetical protein